MSEISTGIRGAGFAVTGGIQRLGGALQTRAFHIDPPVRQPRGSMPTVPGSSDTVEEIDPTRDPFQQISGKTNTHKITRDLRRQSGLQVLQNMMHHWFGLAHGEASNGDAGPRAALEGAL